jgi:hypothetical protein
MPSSTNATRHVKREGNTGNNRSSWRPSALTCSALSPRSCSSANSQQTEIKTFGSGAFWTTTQLLTVSSQIKSPISVGGRILDVLMKIYAITVIAALAGAIGSLRQKRGQEIEDKR